MTQQKPTATLRSSADTSKRRKKTKFDPGYHDDSNLTVEPGSQTGYRVLALMLSGPLLYGLIGWGFDFFVHTEPVGLVVGIIGGLALSCFMIIRRYGQSE